MSAEFPTNLPTFTDPALTENLGDMCGGMGHVNEIKKLHAEIMAGLTKIGKDGSTTKSTIDYKLSGVPTNDKSASLTGTEILTNKTLTSPIIPSMYQDDDKTKLMTLPNTASDTLCAIAATQVLTNKTLTSPAFQGTVDGWILANETWTYASATTITVPSGAVSKYSVGDKFKLTSNSVVLYGYIITVADTLLTVVGNTLTNYTFTANYYSKAESPLNFPQWFAYTPTITVAGGTAPTYTAIFVSKFSIAGRKVTVKFMWRNASGGTAGNGSNGITFTLPVTGVFSDTGYNSYEVMGSAYYHNTGASPTDAYGMVVAAGATTANILIAAGAYITGTLQNHVSRDIGATFSYEI